MKNKKNVVFNDFKKGLNTDQNVINQDPTILTDVDNFIITSKGTLEKRKGLRQINDLDMELTKPEELVSKSVSSYIWTNIDKDLRDILVIQNGHKISFYEYFEGKPITKFPSEIVLTDFLTSTRLLEKNIAINFSQIKDKLVCTYEQMTPFTIEYLDQYQIKAEELQLFVRNTLSKDFEYPVTQRFNTLDEEHMRNLYNAGWEYYEMQYVFDQTGQLPALVENINDLRTPFNEPNLDIIKYQAAQTEAGIHRPKTEEEFAVLQSAFSAKDKHLVDSYNTNNKNFTNEKGYVNISDWKIDVDEDDLTNEFVTGHEIINLYESEMCDAIVNRPILEADDKPIDRLKWNDFHLIDDIHDIFLKDGKIHMVVTFDKEHGLVGGKQQTMNIDCSFNVVHRDIQNQVKMEEGVQESRIFSYSYSKQLRNIYGIEQGQTKTYAEDELTFFSDTTGDLDYTFDQYYLSPTRASMFKPQDNDEIIHFFIRNYATSPFDFKCMNFINIPTVDYSYMPPSNRDWNVVGRFGLTTYDFEPAHIRNKYPAPSYLNNSGFWSLYDRTNIDSGFPFDDSFYYSWNGVNGASGNNISGYVLNMQINPFTEFLANSTQFNILNLKHKEEEYIETEIVKAKLEIGGVLSALSTKCAVLTFNKADFDTVHPDWLFNIDESGNLITYMDIYNSFKMKLTDTLYNNMRKVYEDYKRNEYASNKLDEEYADHPGYLSVERVNSFTWKPRIGGTGTPVNAYNYSFPRVVIEFKKPHGINPYIAGGNNGDSFQQINMIQSNFNSYINPDYNDFIRPRVDIKRNDSQDTNLVENFGKYYSDYSYSMLPIHCKLKKDEDLPQRFLNIKNIVYENVQGNPFYGNNSNVNYFGNNNPNTTYRVNGGNANPLKNKFSHYKVMKNTWEAYYSQAGPDGRQYFFGAYNDEEYLEIVLNEDLYPEAVSLIGSNDVNNAFKRHKLLNYSSIQLSPDGESGYFGYYKIPANTRYNNNGIGQDLSLVDIHTCYDLIEIEEPKMNYNLTIQKNHLEEPITGEFIGVKHYMFGLYPDLRQYNYNEDLSASTLDESSPTGLLQIPTTYENGEYVNLIQDIKFWKFSQDKSLSHTEIQAKFNAYRLEWDWSMDVGAGLDEGPSEIDPDNLQYEETIEQFRPNDACSFGGRIFYAGIDTDHLSRTVFYSQLVKGDVVKPYIEMHHSVNDPTNKDFNKALPTDGGYINISGIEKIETIKVVGTRLLVFATNGVWSIHSPDSNFDVTNYIVKQISTEGCISGRSVNVINNKVMYASLYGLNILEPNATDKEILPYDLTQRRIDKFYDSIPKENKKDMVGEYDSVKNIYYLLYNDGSVSTRSVSDITYNAVLIYNLTTDSFFKFSFGFEYNIKDIFIDNHSFDQLIRLNFVISNGDNLDIYNLSSLDYTDYDIDVAYEGSVTVAQQVNTVISDSLYGGRLITHILNKPDTECYVSLDYDFNHINKKLREHNAFKYKEGKEVSFSKIGLRGEGSSVEVNYRSPSGKSCSLLGFELEFKHRQK